MKPDAAAEIAALVARIADVPPEAVARVETELRRSYGGQRVAILREPPLAVDRIDALLRQGLTVRQIAPRMGVDRATIYRRLQQASARKKGASQPRAATDKRAESGDGRNNPRPS